MTDEEIFGKSESDDDFFKDNNKPSTYESFSQNKNQNKKTSQQSLSKKILKTLGTLVLGIGIVVFNVVSIKTTEKYFPKTLVAGFIILFIGIAELINIDRRDSEELPKLKAVFSKITIGICCVAGVAAAVYFIFAKSWDLFYDILFIAAALTLALLAVRFILNFKEIKDSEDTAGYDSSKSIHLIIAFIMLAGAAATGIFYRDTKVRFADQKIFNFKHEETKILENLLSHEIVPVRFLEYVDDYGNSKMMATIYESEMDYENLTFNLEPVSETDESDYINLSFFSVTDLVKHVAAEDQILNCIVIVNDSNKIYSFTSEELNHYAVSKNFLKTILQKKLII